MNTEFCAQYLHKLSFTNSRQIAWGIKQNRVEEYNYKSHTHSSTRVQAKIFNERQYTYSRKRDFVQTIHVPGFAARNFEHNAAQSLGLTSYSANSIARRSTYLNKKAYKERQQKRERAVVHYIIRSTKQYIRIRVHNYRKFGQRRQ